LSTLDIGELLWRVYVHAAGKLETRLRESRSAAARHTLMPWRTRVNGFCVYDFAAFNARAIEEMLAPFADAATSRMRTLSRFLHAWRITC
jgi:hypothetical protein